MKKLISRAGCTLLSIMMSQGAGAAGEQATGLSSDWLNKGALKGINPPPTQPIE